MNDVMTAEKIAKALPLDVLGQRIYKCKIVFLDVDKREPSYSKLQRFSANCHDYSVVDGEIAYLPEEAYSALKDAVTYITKPANKVQERDGINHDSLLDKYEKIEIKRFDITVLDVMTLVVGENGTRTFKSSSQQLSQIEIDETQKAMIEKEKEKMRKELEDEYDDKLKAEIAKLRSNVPDATPDDDIKDLIGE